MPMLEKIRIGNGTKARDIDAIPELVPNLVHANLDLVCFIIFTKRGNFSLFSIQIVYFYILLVVMLIKFQTNIEISNI
jgi:hypothetical protein